MHPEVLPYLVLMLFPRNRKTLQYQNIGHVIIILKYLLAENRFTNVRKVRINFWMLKYCDNYLYSNLEVYKLKLFT